MNAVVENTSFSILFPSYRITYLQSILPDLTTLLSSYFISTKLVDTELTITTMPQIEDLYMIIRARDMVQAISRGVLLETAKALLDEKNHIVSNIINIKKMVPQDSVFINRRDRLLGPNNNTLKAIKLLTKTEITVKGKSVTIIGKYTGVEEATKIVIQTMNNIHPIYQIKYLMAKKQLSMDKNKENEDWKKFLPEIKKKIKKEKRKI
ncbi:Ribosomal RNA assembly protein [Spraguea lophii 42_110]|uniref:KRR-R motif-containing protein 1 n=1 Tax=Spraguea lophii (strain 42_110) TaxID=1358809 RepID=S7XKN9_SPRLO|nr:Ribosomal RNA assembly protein [Spraguea lophii 42_110]